MTAALVHRGPDQDGMVHWPGIGLASRRLSVVGLHDGRQPMRNAAQTVWVVFNGELFDYPELRGQLEARGHAFATTCDTELLPHLWDEYGESIFEHLRGQFAFALWDRRQRRLVLARDRFGICPLHWTTVRDEHGEWLLFASEIRAILASGMVGARVDLRGIQQVFTLLGVPGPVTCFEGIQSLLPGQCLSIQLRSQSEGALVEKRTYWQLDFPDDGAESDGAPAELIDGLEAVLHRAVKRRLRADVPVVSYLSGGVDSSVVVAMASKLLGMPIPTFTVRVKGLDEGRHARAAADHIGTRPTMIDYGTQEMLRHYPTLIAAAEAPVIDTSAAANLLLARRVHADGYKVALTGEGSDEWLAGYPWFAGTPIIRWLSRFAGGSLVGPGTRLHMRYEGFAPQTYELVRRAESELGGHNPWLMWTALVSQGRLLFFSENMKERLRGYEPFADLELDSGRMRRWHPLHRGIAVGARAQLAGMLLSAKGDRVAMHSSVETRYPFLDEDVVSFLCRLHPHWKLHGLQNKYLLRKVGERWLPSRIAWRRKVMFRAPLDEFHRASAPALFRRLLDEEVLRRTGYFDARAVQHWRQRYRQLPSGLRRAAIEIGLVAVVATQLWHRHFIDPALADA
jgi:asparagine synthase (glutamine-hydrolysing)